MKNILKSIFMLFLALAMGLSIVACEINDYVEDDSDTESGDIYYSEKENIICSWVCVGGGNSTGLYKIIDGKEEPITEFYNDVPAPGNEITGCSENETEVSSEEYKKSCESYNLDYDNGMGPSPSEHYKAAYYVDALVISEENIQSIFETE